MPVNATPTGPDAVAAPKGVLGYYRFTDIFFEWCNALPNPEDISPLKALIAYHALVHPDHPLRKPGVKGIELYLGTFQNGQMRLLFSSAQVEYIRYWLHAVGLTRAPLPLPSSEYLVQAPELRACSPDVYADAAILKRAIKNIEKNNKRLKGVSDVLGARRLAFERVRTLWAARLGTWIAMDFEAWDHDHTLLMEFGWRTVRWAGAGADADAKDGRRAEESWGHLVTHESRIYTQTYVPNNKAHYNFGESEEVRMPEFRKRIRALVDDHRALGPLFLVFHDNNQDVKYLKSAAIQALDRIDLLPDSPARGEVYVVDTAQLFAALEGDNGGSMRSLERVCRHLQIPTEFLHNAGNDAYYTLEAMIAMASGDPLDEQRERRWPNHTVDNQPKVAFREWEEDSDLSDMEGIFGTGVPHVEADDDDIDVE